jgi:hypothetical protein
LGFLLSRLLDFSRLGMLPFRLKPNFNPFKPENERRLPTEELFLKPDFFEGMVKLWLSGGVVLDATNLDIRSAGSGAFGRRDFFLTSCDSTTWAADGLMNLLYGVPSGCFGGSVGDRPGAVMDAMTDPCRFDSKVTASSKSAGDPFRSISRLDFSVCSSAFNIFWLSSSIWAMSLANSSFSLELLSGGAPWFSALSLLSGFL